jgi:uncharacterized damage-inducible protein DinB
MDADDLIGLATYLRDSRARFLTTFRALGWNEFARDRGATWGSSLAIFLHMLDDEEGWIQLAARGRSIANGPDRKATEYHGFDQVAEDDARVGAQTRAFLEQLRGTDLTREVEFAESDRTSRYPLERIVTHALVDEVAHLGELICLLWQLDVKPPYIDWLDYRPG